MRINKYLNKTVSSHFFRFISNYVSCGSVLSFPDNPTVHYTYDNVKSECHNSSGEDGYEIFSFFIQRTDCNDKKFVEIKFYFEDYQLITDSVNTEGNGLNLQDFLTGISPLLARCEPQLYLLCNLEDEGAIIINDTVARFTCTKDSIFISQLEGKFQKENPSRKGIRESIIKKQMKPIESFTHMNNNSLILLHEINNKFRIR